MKKYKLYLLDFDGTAFDTVDSLVDVFNMGFERIGRTCSIEDVKVYMHHSIEEVVGIAKIKPEEISPFVDGIMDGLRCDLSLEKIKPYYDLIKFIEIAAKLHSFIGIVSNNSDDHIARVFALNDISTKDFKCIIGHSEKRRTKPYPDMLEYAVEISKLDKKDICYIGDSLQDAEAASEANIDGYLLDRDDIYSNSKFTRIKSLLDMFDVEDK